MGIYLDSALHSGFSHSFASLSISSLRFRDDYLPLFQDGYRLKNDDYFTLFDLRFAGMPNVAYAYLEKEMQKPLLSQAFIIFSFLYFDHDISSLVLWRVFVQVSPTRSL